MLSLLKITIFPKQKWGGLCIVKIALIANRVFFKTLPRSDKTSFMTKGHGQGVLKRKNYRPQVSVGNIGKITLLLYHQTRVVRYLIIIKIHRVWSLSIYCEWAYVFMYRLEAMKRNLRN